MALEDKEIESGLIPDADIATEIRGRLSEGKLSCAAAFAIAHDLDRDPLTVGQTADAMEIRLTRCQLGLFGYPGKQGWQSSGVTERATPEGLEAALHAACDAEGRLPCAKAWEVAAAFSIPRLQVGWVSEGLGIRIITCQLGAF